MKNEKQCPIGPGHAEDLLSRSQRADVETFGDYRERDRALVEMRPVSEGPVMTSGLTASLNRRNWRTCYGALCGPILLISISLSNVS